MSRVLTTEECLSLDKTIYNMAMELQWKEDKIKKNLSGDLKFCIHCNRKYVICCICNEAQDDWNKLIIKVQKISERNRSGEF